MFSSGSGPVWPWTYGLIQGSENSLDQTKSLGHSSQKFVMIQTNLNCGITIPEYQEIFCIEPRTGLVPAI